MREVRTIRIFREYSPSISLVWVFSHSFQKVEHFVNTITSCLRLGKPGLGLYCLSAIYNFLGREL